MPSFRCVDTCGRRHHLILRPQAQSNLNDLNTIVWGTCNTSIEEDDCAANMDWFSTALSSSCDADLKDANSMAVNSQIGTLLQFTFILDIFTHPLRSSQCVRRHA